MSKSRLISNRMAWTAAVAAGLPHVASACATCFGDPNSAEVKAMNVGIVALLLFCGFVLGGVSAFIFYLYRRSKQLFVEGPEDLGISRMSKVRIKHD